MEVEEDRIRILAEQIDYYRARASAAHSSAGKVSVNVSRTGRDGLYLTGYGMQTILEGAVATVIEGDFEWDDEKARANLDKHGVSFPEAATVLAEDFHESIS